MGELLEKKGQFKEAAEAYGQAAKQGPRSGELRLRQASALLNAEAPAEAARDVLEEYSQEQSHRRDGTDLADRSPASQLAAWTTPRPPPTR